MILKPFSKEISKNYRKLCKKYNTPKTKTQILEQFIEKGLLYGHERKVVDIFSQPIFYGDKVINYLQSIIDKTNLLFSEVYSILNNGKSKNYIKFLGGSLNQLDYYKDLNPAQIFRIDGAVLRESKKLAFIEFNTNNPGGLFNNDGIEKVLLEYDPALKELSKIYELSYYNRIEMFAKMLINRYETFKKRNRKNLGDLLLILGCDSEPKIGYSQILKYLIDYGIKAKIVINTDKRLVYDGNDVKFDGQKVAMINRRIETKNELAPLNFLREASINGDVCVTNPFGSGLLGMKKLFVLLTDKNFQKNLSKSSINLIEEFIPETYDFNNFLEERKNEIFENKDNYLIKINNSEQGNGVFIGKKFSKRNWKKLVLRYKKDQKNLKNSSLIVQEFLDITKIKKKEYDYSLLSIEGQFFPFVRVAKKPNLMTNISQGGSYVPCFYYKMR